MPICALPPESVAAAEVYEPLLSITEPVGVPLEPPTDTVTCNDCVVVMLCEAGVTVTVGVDLVGGGGVEPPPQPVAQNPPSMLNENAASFPLVLIVHPPLFTRVSFLPHCRRNRSICSYSQRQPCYHGEATDRSIPARVAQSGS